MRKKEKSTIWLIYFPLSWVTYAKPRGETTRICQSTLCFRICQEDLYHWRKIFISLQKVVNISFPIIQNSTCWRGKPKTSSPIFFMGHCTVVYWKLFKRKNYIKQSAWTENFRLQWIWKKLNHLQRILKSISTNETSMCRTE